jgi:outer membrane lipoprotein-sorting protein
MFGVLVSIAIAGAFVAALTVLPALLKLVGERSRSELPKVSTLSQRYAPLLAVAIGVWIASGATARAGELDADKIMAAVAAREEGDSVDRIAQIQLIDRHGVVREQVARAVRKNVADGRRTAIFYQSPANVRGTSFLVFDYRDPSHASDQWLYLPALRKVRRVPAADRGDYFLGTDLTYDEIRNDSRVTLEDWRFHLIDRSEVDGTACAVIEGTTVSEAVAKELGYSRANWWIDETSDMALRIEYWDRAGQLLKTVEHRDIRQISGIWSAMRIDVTNHKTGHRTRIDFRDVQFNQKLADTLFTQQQMERGL